MQELVHRINLRQILATKKIFLSVAPVGRNDTESIQSTKYKHLNNYTVRYETRTTKPSSGKMEIKLKFWDVRKYCRQNVLFTKNLFTA